MSTELFPTLQPAANEQKEPESFLGTRLGLLTLVLLCAVQFLDIADASIVNVALPSIQRALLFSQKSCNGW